MNTRIFAFLCLLLVLCAAARAEQPTSAVLAAKWTAEQYAGLEEIEAEVVAQVNAERAKDGLSTVEVSAALRVAACQHSAEMAEKRYFDHESPVAGWRMPWQRAYMAGYWEPGVGENIIRVENCTEHTPAAIAALFLKLWLDSPAHRGNLLNPKWTVTGVGIVKDGAVYYGTQLFGTPRVIIEQAAVGRVTGELVRLRLEGSLSAGVINLWADSQPQQTIHPLRGAWSVTIYSLRKTGSHEIIVAVGQRAAWIARLDPDAAEERMLQVTRTIRSGVVARTAVTLTPFTGLRLTGMARVPANQEISVLRDGEIVAAPRCDEQHRITFDLILPDRPEPYRVSVAAGEVLEELLFIDTSRTPGEAFLCPPA